jgi:hypothetical protein
MGNKAQKRAAGLVNTATAAKEKEVPRDHAFRVEFLDNSQAKDGDGEHNEYLIKVTTMPLQQVTFLIRDRYSVLRSFQEDIVKELFKKDTSTLPPFPGRKLIGGSDPKFLE